MRGTGVGGEDGAKGQQGQSLSGFRDDAFGRLFRRPPGQARGAECIVVRGVRTPLGPMIAGATGAGICFLEFTERRRLEAQVRTLERRLGLIAVPGEHPHVERLVRELTEYFAGSRRRFEVPLVAPGTPFQTEVWAALRAIPYGKTRSYAEVARGIGRPSATRAVARANGTNRIAIVIPCHRVVETGGGLGGYGGGLWRKRRLLALESGERLLEEVKEA